MEIRSYFYNQEDNMINLKSLMNVFGKRPYLQGIFTYNILLKRAFLKSFLIEMKNFLIYPCVAKHLVNSDLPIISSTSLSLLKCIYWLFLVLSKIFYEWLCLASFRSSISCQYTLVYLIAKMVYFTWLFWMIVNQ